MWVTESRLAGRGSLSLSRVPIPARLVSIALPIEPAATLTDREVGRFPLRRLALRPRESGSNQWTMDRPLVLRTRRDRLFDVARFGLFRGFHRFGRDGGRVFDHVFYCFFSINQNR
jgi:hypothetical protein